MDNEVGGWFAVVVFFGFLFLLVVGMVVDTMEDKARPYYIGLSLVVILSGMAIYAIEVFR